MNRLMHRLAFHRLVVHRLVFLKSRRQWRQGIKAALITLSVLLVIHMNFGILINNTASLPYKVFLHLKTWPPSKGEYTVIRRAFYPIAIIKQIKGEGGDILHYKGAEVLELWINDQKIGYPQTLNSLGKPLTPIAAQIIPQGFVFLFASNHKSFDSRYAEMGLIAKRDLQGRAVPLW